MAVGSGCLIDYELIAVEVCAKWKNVHSCKDCPDKNKKGCAIKESQIKEM
jgi:hypothetical protein